HRIVQRAFEREAKILTQLEHEAFPQVIDYFVENECQFLVMELIQGKDLSELLKKRKTPFEVEEVLQWGIQLLDALDYLHNLEPPTIHRDIKPQNLKLNSRKRIKLLDFGIAKGADFPSNVTFSNQTFIAATFNYSPFEQVFRVLDSSFKEAFQPFYGKQLAEVAIQSADARSDIYSLGATFYHLLTKHLPFDSLKRTLELWVGNLDPLPTPQNLNPKIPTEISEWIMKAMAVEKDKRFESATVMKDALQEIVEGNKLEEESTRKLKWQKEQELLRIERARLAEERRKFEEERQHFLDITQEPLSEAMTVRDVIEGNSNNLKTNTAVQPDLFNQPSIVTLVGEKPKKEIPVAESPTDFT
ncbi:MAG: serine/threonine-protein kinase, partial [Acidobacteriota bacterium]